MQLKAQHAVQQRKLGIVVREVQRQAAVVDSKVRRHPMQRQRLVADKVAGLPAQGGQVGLEVAGERDRAAEAEAFGVLFGTEDGREGLAAFVAKRPAQFKGR